MIFTFTMNHLFISTVRDYAFPPVITAFGALFALYIIWGSTYFVIRIGVESWPPLMMAGVRFLAAILLLAFLLLRGHKLPPLRPLLNAAADWPVIAGCR